MGFDVLIFHGTEEGNKGKMACMKRRPPNFTKFPRKKLIELFKKEFDDECTYVYTLSGKNLTINAPTFT